MGRLVKFASQIEEEALEELRKFSEESDKTLSRLLTEAVKDYLERARIRPAFRSAVDDVLRENAELLKRLAK